jgi:transcriptional regulator with XRE-family HTH domain
MKTLAERLRYAMEVLPPKRIKGVELADAVGVKPPSVSDWLSGKSKTMEGENLLRAAKFLGVNPMWLASGIGEIKAVRSPSQISTLAGLNENFQLEELVQKLIKLEAEKKLTSKDLSLIDHFLDKIASSTFDTKT